MFCREPSILSQEVQCFSDIFHHVVQEAIRSINATMFLPDCYILIKISRMFIFGVDSLEGRNIAIAMVNIEVKYLSGWRL